MKVEKIWLVMLITLLMLGWGAVSCLNRPAGINIFPVLPSGPDPSGTAISDRKDFRVEVWVNHPRPERGEQVVLHGSLIKHGVRLGAMTMEGYWPDPELVSVVPNCRVQVIYGSGVCRVDTSSFEVGQPVHLWVEFFYEGKTFRDSTEVIPQ